MEKYFIDEQFISMFIKYVEFENLPKKYKILDKIKTILDKIKATVNIVVEIEDSKDIVKDANDAICNIITCIDVSRIIINMCINNSDNKISYKAIEDIFRKINVMKEFKDFSWRNDLKTIREEIEHEGKGVQVIRRNGDKVYIQSFRENNYPRITDLLEVDNYVDFKNFMSFKIYCFLKYLENIFNHLVEQYAKIKKEVILELESSYKFEIEILEPIMPYAEEAINKINNYTLKDKQDILLYKKMQPVNLDDNEQCRQSKKQKLVELKEAIERKEFYLAEPFLKAEVYFYLGNICVLDGEYSNAKEYFRQALRYNISPILYAHLILCYSKESEEISEKARSEINLIIEEYTSYEKELDYIEGIDREIISLYNNIATIAIKTKNYALVKNLFDKSIMINIDSANEVIYNYGILYKKLGEGTSDKEDKKIFFNRAIYWFNEAVSRNSKDIEAYVKILYLCIQNNEMEMFKEYLLNALFNNADKEEIIVWCNWALHQQIFISDIKYLSKINRCLDGVNISPMNKEQRNRVNELKDKLSNRMEYIGRGIVVENI